LTLPGDIVHLNPGLYGAQTILKGSHSQLASDSPVTFQAIQGTVTTGTIVLGANSGTIAGDTPSHLHFDGLTVNGCVTTNYSGGVPGGATSDSLDFSFVNGHVWNMTNATCHLLNLSGLDGINVQHTVLGPMCCGADAVEFGIPRNGATPDANATFIDVAVHDVYDTCNSVSASIKTTYGCSGIGYGDNGCCDHVDGFQGFGLLGTNLFEQVRVWAINPRTPTSTGAAQSFFMSSANGGHYSNITIENSYFGCGCGTNDVSISGPGSSFYAGYLKVRYNTIQASFPVYNNVLAPGTAVEFTGNIIGGYLHPSSSIACTILAGDGSLIQPAYSHNLFGGGPTGGCGTGDLRGHALFTNTNFYNPDFTPQAGSLAIKAGDPASHPPVDVNGNPRPQSLAPDIGAVQVQALLVDVTSPTLANVPPNLVLEASSARGAAATYANPTATDDVDPHPTVSCAPASGSILPFGATTVTCTAVDAAGNRSTGSFIVTVGDTTSPTAPGSPSPSNATQSSADLSWAASRDAVGTTGYDLWLDGVPSGSTSGSRFTFGGLVCATTHTLAVAAHDAAGNKSQLSSAYASTLPCLAPIPTTLALLNSTANPTTATHTFALSAVQAGDTVIAVVFGNSRRPLSVQDNLGNTYTMDATSGSANALSSISIYHYRYSAAQTSLTLSVSWTSAIFHQQVAVYAVTNLLAAPVDGSAASGAKSATPSISAPSTTKPNELAIAAFRVLESNWVGSGLPAAGWNVLTDVFPPSGNGHVIVAYRLLPTTGPVSLGFSIGARTTDWSGALTTYAGG
jgi:hypothetical protein